MSNMPSIELLESTHNFPCHFVFKVIGNPKDQFAERIRQAVDSLMPANHGATFAVRPSSKGRHISVSVDVIVASAETVQRLYEQFLKLDGLEMLL